MKNSIFVIGDGDGIRKKVESYLLSGHLESLGQFSFALTNAISEIAKLAVQNMESKIVFAGGDDICFITTSSNFHKEKIQELIEEFFRKTECSISFGVGENIEEAFLNLRRAKSMGGGCLIMSDLL
jgi:minimal CRISPR polymerase domain